MLTPSLLGLLLLFAPLADALAGETIKVAAIYALTGVAANANASSVRGVRLGVHEVNQRGGVLGRKLELIELDNQSSPIGSKVAADRAVRAGALAIIGSAWSSHSLAVAKVAQSLQIPMITNVSTHPEITAIGDYIFRVCFNDRFQGRVMAWFARRELNAATAVIFVDVSSDFSIELAREFQSNFEKLGGRILLRLQYKQKQENFRQLVLEAQEMNPEVLFIPGYDESTLIIKEATRAGLKAVPLGGDGWDSFGFLASEGKLIKHAYYCTHWAKDMNRKASLHYVAAHKNPDSIRAPEVLAYDAVLILADAIHRAGSVERPKIRDALANTQGFPGVTGAISFAHQGDATKPAVIMEIVEGREHYYQTVEFEN